MKTAGRAEDVSSNPPGISTVLGRLGNRRRASFQLAAVGKQGCLPYGRSPPAAGYRRVQASAPWEESRGDHFFSGARGPATAATAGRGPTATAGGGAAAPTA